MHTGKDVGQRRPKAASSEEDRDLEQFRATFRDADYYSTGRDWHDYAPAYRYGRDAFVHHAGQRFDDVERTLEEHWNDVRAVSRLVWAEARGAVRDAWLQAEAELPRPPPRRRDDHH